MKTYYHLIQNLLLCISKLSILETPHSSTYSIVNSIKACQSQTHTHLHKYTHTQTHTHTHTYTHKQTRTQTHNSQEVKYSHSVLALGE